jgi:hypothetical protein
MNALQGEERTLEVGKSKRDAIHRDPVERWEGPICEKIFSQNTAERVF